MNTLLLQNQGDSDKHVELARIWGDSLRPGIEVLLASTPGLRRLLNSPEVCGNEFQAALSGSLREIFERLTTSRDISRLGNEISHGPLDVVYILRGGLNFDLHHCLEQVTGRGCEVSFVSSQRASSDDGTSFKITEDGYRKWNVHDQGIICIGDIAATGTTLVRVLNELGDVYESQGKTAKWLVIVTIGTMQCLDVLSEAVLRLSGRVKIEGATIVFLEQMFNLYGGGNSLLSSTHLPSTDFFRNLYPRAVTFEEESLRNPICLVERCAIYDGGSRSFEPQIYLSNLESYWTRFRDFDHESLMQLLYFKSDLLDCRLPFEAWRAKRQWWSNDGNSSRLQELYDLSRSALVFFESSAVSDICERRLQEIRRQA